MAQRVARTEPHHILTWIAISLGALLLALAVTLILKWPFKHESTVHSLEHFTASLVQIETFDRVYIPHPGYVATHVTFSRRTKSGSTQLASVERLECKGSWLSMLTLTHHIEELNIQGLHVKIPAKVPLAMKLHPELKEQTSVTKLIADGALLEIASRHANREKLRFVFSQLTLGNIEKNKPMLVRTLMRNPSPPTELAVRANVGPFVLAALGRTQMSGSFDFTRADLSGFHEIRGMLESHGRFHGTLAQCQVQGRARVPDFEVISSGHPIDLAAEFSAVANGEDGNVAIQSVAAHLLRTTVQGSGAVTDGPRDAGKSVTLDFQAEHGQVEDLLRLFASSDPPSMKGPITFHTEVQLPPGDGRFLQRVRLNGNFAIVRARFGKKQTQEKVDELSNRARESRKGPKLRLVSADLKGHVHLQHAIANLSDLSFSVPGAAVQGEGTYNLITKQIDLSGKLLMQARLSKAAGGVKSILLMPLNPLFKRENAGSVLPIRITGDYSHPIFRASLRPR
jgi:hypothetical protein